MADLISVLYAEVLNIDPCDPNNVDRDRFFQSKGHAAAVLFSALALKGFFPINQLDAFCESGQFLGGHVSRNGIPGVEFSTGSLGHALSVANGVALCAKREGKSYKIYTILSDGEMDEGSNWEAVLFAAHHRLNNLCMIIDYNKIQSLGRVEDVMSLEPLKEKIASFGWKVVEIDGHEHQQIRGAFEKFKMNPTKKPFCIIAHTIKGKGVDFMEDNLSWHYKSPNNHEYEEAVRQIKANYAQ